MKTCSRHAAAHGATFAPGRQRRADQVAHLAVLAQIRHGHPLGGVGRAAGLDDPRLAVGSTSASKTICSAWKSSRRPDGAVPSKCVEVTSSDLARRALQAGLLAHLADHALARVLAVVDPAARQRPGAGVRPARGVPGEQHVPVADHEGVRRDPLEPEGPVLLEDLGHQRRRSGPGRPGRPLSGFQAASTVEPSTSTTRGSGASTGTQPS